MALTNVNVTAVPHKSGDGTTVIYKGNSRSANMNVNNINGSTIVMDTVNTKNITADKGNFIYIQAQEGNIVRISGDDLLYKYGRIDDFTSDNITANEINTESLQAVKAWIDTLNSREITTEYLTVTKQAHFFELIVDKLRSVGGQLVITPANCVIDAAFAYDSNNQLIPEVTPENLGTVAYYEVWWKCTDNNGRKTDQGFLVNDQAMCMSFNNVHEGTNYDVSNKYYWRLVTDILPDTFVNMATGDKLTEGTGTNNTQVEKNRYHITLASTYYYNDNNEVYPNGIQWYGAVPDLSTLNIQTNVSWDDDGPVIDAALSGTFSSASKQYGLNIKPLANTSGHPNYITDALDFQIYQDMGGGRQARPQNINVGVYYEDGTFSIFNNIDISPYDSTTPSNSFWCHIDLGHPNMPIESIVVTSTNDVDWHLCHGMRLSNDFRPESQGSTKPASDSGCDYMLDGFVSVPTAGDNIVQLGYRGTDEDEDKDRQSAIIIASYKSIDSGGTYNGYYKAPIKTPSYAQYMGINDFNLASHRQSYFDANGAKFIGDITLCSADIDGTTGSIGDIITNISSSSSDYLIANKETVMAQLKSAVENSSEVKVLVDLDYSIRNISVADGTEILDWNDVSNDYSLTFQAFNSTGGVIGYSDAVKTQTLVNGKFTTGSECQYNLLRLLNNIGPYDYLECQQDANARCPMYLKVTLKYGNKVIDQRTVPVQVQTGAVLKVMDDRIVSAVSEEISDLNESIQNITEFIQTAEGFDQMAQRMTIIEEGLDEQGNEIITIKNEVSHIINEPDELALVVARQLSSNQGFLSEIASNVSVTADGITLSHLNELMQRTGIDIFDGNINLVGANTNVLGDLNILNDNAIQVINGTKDKVTRLTGRELGPLNTYSPDGSIGLIVTKEGTKASGDYLAVDFGNTSIGKYRGGNKVDVTCGFDVYDAVGTNTITQGGPNTTLQNIKVSAAVRYKHNGSYINVNDVNNNPLSISQISVTVNTSHGTRGTGESLYNININGKIKDEYDGEELYVWLKAEYTFKKKSDDYNGLNSSSYIAQLYIKSEANEYKQINEIGTDAISLKGNHSAVYDGDGIMSGTGILVNNEFVWWGPFRFPNRTGFITPGIEEDYMFGIRDRRHNFRVSTFGIQRTLCSTNGIGANGTILEHGETSPYLWNGRKCDLSNSSRSQYGDNVFCDIGSCTPVYTLNYVPSYTEDSKPTLNLCNICADGQMFNVSGQPLLINCYGIIVNNSGTDIDIKLPPPSSMCGKMLKLKGINGGIRIKCATQNVLIKQGDNKNTKQNMIDLTSKCVSLFSTGYYWCLETPI